MPTKPALPKALTALFADPAATLVALDRIDCAESLAAYVQRSWHIVEPGRPLVWGWALDVMCQHLEAVTDGEISRLLMNVPPGSMKSLLVNVFWPSWEWGPRKRPDLRYVAASYAERLTVRDNRRCRMLVSSEWYRKRWPHVELTADQNQKVRFDTTATGFKLATSVGGVGTGERGDRFVIDDPHNVVEAESEVVRTGTIQWFSESVPLRLNDPSSSAIIVIMQRVHEGDVSGYIIENDLGYCHLCLPMEFEPGRAAPNEIGFLDPRTEEGELLFPERFPAEVVERDKLVMGPYAVAGQFQQRPEVRGGAIIKREWWQLWDQQTFPAMEYTLASLDPAYSEKQEADYSALTIWGAWADEYGVMRLMLMYAWRARMPLHDLVTYTYYTCGGKRLAGETEGAPGDKDEYGLPRRLASYPVNTLLIENKASGISVGQELRRLFGSMGFGLQMVDPSRAGDKVARVHSVSHLFHEGLIYRPDRGWAQMVEDEFAMFPRGTHDDLVDSSVQALRYLRTAGIAVRNEERLSELYDASAYRKPARPLYPV